MAYLTQTTLSMDETRRHHQAITRGTRDQVAAQRGHLLRHAKPADRRAGARPPADLVLVVGSRNSHNSIRMVEVAELAGTPAHLVPDVGPPGSSGGSPACGRSGSAPAPAPQKCWCEEVLDRLAGHGLRKSANGRGRDRGRGVLAASRCRRPARRRNVTNGKWEAAR